MRYLLLAALPLAFACGTPPDSRGMFTAELAAVEEVTGETCAVPVYVVSAEEAKDECGSDTDACYQSGALLEADHITLTEYADRALMGRMVAHEYTHCAIGEPDHGGQFWDLYYEALELMK
jgi:hypothetical protein